MWDYSKRYAEAKARTRAMTAIAQAKSKQVAQAKAELASVEAARKEQEQRVALEMVAATLSVSGLIPESTAASWRERRAHALLAGRTAPTGASAYMTFAEF